MDDVRAIAEMIKKVFGESILSIEEVHGEVNLVVDAGSIPKVCELLRDDPGAEFDLLIALTAIDYWPGDPRFHRGCLHRPTLARLEEIPSRSRR